MIKGDAVSGEVSSVDASAPVTQIMQSSRPEGRDLLAMVGRIGIIIFTVEAMIMLLLLRGWSWHWDALQEGLLDATMLTLVSSPIIYKWVAEPFMKAASEAKSALAIKIDIQAEQATALQMALTELKRLLEQNEGLRRHLQLSNQRIGQINEHVLQKVGADLHDGPAQLLTYALLRLRKLGPAEEDDQGGDNPTQLQLIRSVLTDVLTEIRNVSAGLSLPQLNGASLEETVRLAASMHQGHTGTKVSISIDDAPDVVPEALKVCIYRFVQEALTNANRHAEGRGQRVSIKGGDGLTIAVADSGPGFDPDALSGGLGLTGMRARVGSLGGHLVIASTPGVGTRLTATFPAASLDLTDGHNA